MSQTVDGVCAQVVDALIHLLVPTPNFRNDEELVATLEERRLIGYIQPFTDACMRAQEWDPAGASAIEMPPRCQTLQVGYSMHEAQICSLRVSELESDLNISRCSMSKIPIRWNGASHFNNDFQTPNPPDCQTAPFSNTPMLSSHDELLFIVHAR